MTVRPTLRNRLTAWYEAQPHPGFFLTGVIIFLYAPSLLGGFMLDDHRCIRVLREFRDGQRDRPAVYEFLLGDDSNARERLTGNYPWWMADHLKYRHCRPTAEWFLYAEFRAFGDQPVLYHVVSLALYCISVLVLLQFFRFICDDEALARWAALIFAIMASHTIPVIFVSAQCDLLALLCVTLAMLLLARFIRTAQLAALLAATLLFMIGLGAKEAVLPVAAGPIVLLLRWRDQPAARRCALVAAILWISIGLAWLAWYARNGYGSNAAAMLDPMKDTSGYIRLAPWRILLLLCTWVVVINPFLFEINLKYHDFIFAIAAIGTATLIYAAAILWKYRRRHPLLLPMSVWSLMFLPILACTPPDDRVMMLPGIGLSLIAALWLVESPRSALAAHNDIEPPPVATTLSTFSRLRNYPLLIFILCQPIAIPIITGVFNFMEWEAQRHLRIMANTFLRPMTDDDSIFIVNTRRTVESLFTHDRFHRAAGRGHATVLCDVADPKVTRLDPHTLRIESSDPPLFSSFLGKMGTPRDAPRRVGDTLHAREFTARIIDVQSGQVRAIELTFKEKIDSDRYRFIQILPAAPPVVFTP
jgi:hypothetical protein